MIVESIKSIPDKYKNSFQKCKKCNGHPIIKNYLDDISGDNWSFISCTNDNCSNQIVFTGQINKVVDSWNKINK